jgi:hypothetical protein
LIKTYSVFRLVDIGYLQRIITTMQGDVGALPFEGGTFDSLEPYYDIVDFHVEGAMVYFRVRKQ